MFKCCSWTCNLKMKLIIHNAQNSDYLCMILPTWTKHPLFLIRSLLHSKDRFLSSLWQTKSPWRVQNVQGTTHVQLETFCDHGWMTMESLVIPCTLCPVVLVLELTKTWMILTPYTFKILPITCNYLWLNLCPDRSWIILVHNYSSPFSRWCSWIIHSTSST